MNYEGKRNVLDMLGITVWLDGESIEITGIIDPSIGLMPSSIYLPSPAKESIGLPEK
jgi:hypothetical protein